MERRENRSGVERGGKGKGVERGGKGWKGKNGAAVTAAATVAVTAAVNPAARLDYVGRFREMAREDRGYQCDRARAGPARQCPLRGPAEPTVIGVTS